MRSRATHLAVLLLLLSSLAVADLHAETLDAARTPGGVFVRNLLLQAAVDEAEPAGSTLATATPNASSAVAPQPRTARAISGAAHQAAHVHAVTGSSL